MSHARRALSLVVLAVALLVPAATSTVAMAGAPAPAVQPAGDREI